MPATSQELRSELEAIRLLSDEQIEDQVREGADASALLEEQDEARRKRKALAMTLAAAEHRELTARQAEAKALADRLIAEMEHQRRQAAYALSDCEAAVSALEAAIKCFDAEAAKASELAARANQVSRQAGMPAPISHPEHNSELFSDLSARLGAVMHRRGRIHFDQYRINPETRP